MGALCSSTTQAQRHRAAVARSELIRLICNSPEPATIRLISNLRANSNRSPVRLVNWSVTGEWAPPTIVAFLMGTHPRAGAGSIVRQLRGNQHLLQLICCLVKLERFVLEAHSLETVGHVLAQMAVRFELTPRYSLMLQMVFNNKVVPRDSTLKAAGLCDMAIFGILNVEKARVQCISILEAAKRNRVEEVRLVCDLTPDRVNGVKGGVSAHCSCSCPAGLLSVVLLRW